MTQFSGPAIRYGVIALLAFLCFQAFELRTKLRMLRSLDIVLHPESLSYSELFGYNTWAKQLTMRFRRSLLAYENDDHPNVLPVRVKETAMEVEWLDDEVYGLYADSDWRSLFPGGDSGFITLGATRGAFLSSDHKSTSQWSQNVFAVGMYHQLHCLDVFRHSYVAAKAGALVYPGNGTGVDHHINHCLSYMREMVLCTADTTLIHTREVEPMGGKGRYEATSIGTVHRCRDWTQVRKFVESNKAPL